MIYPRNEGKRLDSISDLHINLHLELSDLLAYLGPDSTATNILRELALIKWREFEEKSMYEAWKKDRLERRLRSYTKTRRRPRNR